MAPALLLDWYFAPVLLFIIIVRILIGRLCDSFIGVNNVRNCRSYYARMLMPLPLTVVKPFVAAATIALAIPLPAITCFPPCWFTIELIAPMIRESAALPVFNVRGYSPRLSGTLTSVALIPPSVRMALFKAGPVLTMLFVFTKFGSKTIPLMVIPSKKNLVVNARAYWLLINRRVFSFLFFCQILTNLYNTTNE